MRVLEEIIQALAQQQYDFEKSIKVPYKSPPRSSLRESEYGLEDETDCEEYFDAFDDEETDQTNDEEKNVNKNAAELTKIEEIEEFQLIHDLKATSSKR